ncbi:MAG: hypothetical protein JXA30_15650 [Deltaproteobacteria bacterium]|nr:hypothetical protein [Deltaproteobacteria bacterium]
MNDEWSQEMEKRHVPVVWEAIQDAFENNAPEVHSYLHLTTGEVIRIVDGIADPNMHARIVSDPSYIRIDPVSSREQYRWMERFISTIEDEEFHKKLLGAIDGKGAFRRFKDVLMHFPVDRERWFAFRAERLKVAIEAWLDTHGLVAVEREKWEVPSANDVREAVNREEVERPERRNRFAAAEASRQRLQELVELLPVRELENAVAYLEFLRERKHLPRVTSKSVQKNAKASELQDSDSPEAESKES